jgi:hypothetical protein
MQTEAELSRLQHIFMGFRYLQNFYKNFRDPGSDGTTRHYIRSPGLGGSMRGSSTLLSGKSGLVPERIQESDHFAGDPPTRPGALLAGLFW